MHRFFQVTTFLLALLLATTHGRNIPNSLNNHVLKLNSDLSTTTTTIGSIERRDWTSIIWGTGCSEYSSTASIEPRALYASETPLFADGFPTTTITDAMATPLVARDDTVTEGSDILAMGKLPPSIVGILLSLRIWDYAEQINLGYDYGYGCGFIKLGLDDCLAWIPRILINGLNVSPFPSLEDLSVCVLSIGAA
ncbi:hypothetical protein BCON_0035g00300 [Botryotinia convoluta]|uniref:Peptidase A1 domain-containing protein n=1 Tax=Botryotinia convoluta TaxID=54673 RepID=A0A4Z1IIV6_9HELO|nr:hypothetical protein BCON_0035g00300 [Botryotinia convoluta]